MLSDWFTRFIVPFVTGQTGITLFMVLEYSTENCSIAMTDVQWSCTLNAPTIKCGSSLAGVTVLCSWASHYFFFKLFHTIDTVGCGKLFEPDRNVGRG